MRTIDIHEAKTHLSQLVEQAAKGYPFIIAKAGTPIAKVVPLEEIKRTGFLCGEIKVPDDFDQMGQTEIQKLFGKDA